MKAAIEKFKDIPGYEGLYQVSNYGCIRSLKYGKVRYMVNGNATNGYDKICLCRDGKRKWFMVHRLVWEAFNGPIPDGMQIDHINTVRDDNRLINLRMVTPKENHANPITATRNREANRKLYNKPILQLDKTTGEVIREWECTRDAWRELGINFCNISECCNNNRKSAGGYRWCFA